MIKYLLVLSATLAGVFACDVVPHITNLDFEQFKGKWYEHQYYSSDNEGNAKCVSATFFTNTVNNQNRVIFNNHYSSDSTSQKSIGKITLTNGTGFTVTHQNNQIDKYSVVATDYKTFAILSRCDTNSKSYSIYILHRGKNINTYNGNKYKVFKDMKTALNVIGLNRCQFEDAVCYNSYY